MLNLANLRTLLSRVLAPPGLHTVALFTPEGELVCYASDPSKTKDHVRVLVGLSTETWQETREQHIGRVDFEVCVGYRSALTGSLTFDASARTSARLAHRRSQERGGR